MRSTLIVALAAAVLGQTGTAQYVTFGRQTDNVLTRYLDRANIHPPVRVGALTVFPISLATVTPIGPVLTMDQALGKGLLVIEELKSAQVNRARFINKSGQSNIFLMAGEVISGGRQNRTLASDALLGPDSAVVLPLYCVQRGRWAGGAQFGKVTTVAPQAVRQSAVTGAGQQAVWNEVAKANARLKVATRSEDLSAAMTSQVNVRRLKRLREQVVPNLPKGCTGVVVARGGRIVGADLFNNPELMAAMRKKVLDSYLSEWGIAPVRAAAPAGRAPGQKDIRRWLQAAYQSRFTKGPRRGVATVHHLRGARHGEALVWFKAPRMHNRVPDRGNWFLVHAALMERVVPVKPVPVRPIPVPRPVPLPRPSPMPESR